MSRAEIMAHLRALPLDPDGRSPEDDAIFDQIEAGYHREYLERLLEALRANRLEASPPVAVAYRHPREVRPGGRGGFVIVGPAGAETRLSKERSK